MAKQKLETEIPRKPKSSRRAKIYRTKKICVRKRLCFSLAEEERGIITLKYFDDPSYEEELTENLRVLKEMSVSRFF